MLNWLKLKMVLAAACIAAVLLFAVSPSAGQVRIMPLGDSITRGTYGYLYRADLRQRLTTEAGIDIDYVGTGVEVGGSHGPGPEFDTPYLTELMEALDYDLEHEGWGGYKISDIAANIDSWLAANPPDMILLMIGTNDLREVYSNEHEQLYNLIGQILTQVASVDLFVASVPPIGGSSSARNELVETYNDYIPGIVQAYANQGYSVYFVDAYGALDVSVDLSDDVHLTAQGYEKVSGAWYEVIVQVFNGNEPPSVMITNPPDTSEFPEYTDILITADAVDSDAHSVFHLIGVIGVTGTVKVFYQFVFG